MLKLGQFKQSLKTCPPFKFAKQTNSNEIHLCRFLIKNGFSAKQTRPFFQPRITLALGSLPSKLRIISSRPECQTHKAPDKNEKFRTGSNHHSSKHAQTIKNSRQVHTIKALNVSEPRHKLELGVVTLGSKL